MSEPLQSVTVNVSVNGKACRRDRAEALIAFLGAHGCDTSLASRALQNAGIAPRTRTRVLARLTPNQ